MKKVKITISAECGCGKETLTYIILKALTEHGINADFTDFDYPDKHEFFHDRESKVQERIISLKNEIRVDIEQVQMPRNSMIIE